MEYLRAEAAAQVDAKAIARFLGLAAASILLPFFIHLQWVTGPMINAILILTLFLVGVRSALILCLIPSLIALSQGLLPAVLAPMVPFIMISNVLFVLTIEWFSKNIQNEQKGYWLGVISGALFKFLFLFSSINLIGRLLIKSELTIKVAQILNWPQFATAILGGVIAWAILIYLGRIKPKN